MAKQTVVTLVDDLDGKAIEEGKGETVKFSLDGQSYEIDLSTDNAKALRDALKPYTKAGRTVSARGTRSTGRKGGSKEELSEARKWLRENGHDVSDRGRIPASLMDLFQSSK